MILAKDTYENVKDMLESPDHENTVVGLTCIENADFRDNLIYILCLIKESDIPAKQWEKHAPETAKQFKNLFKGSITYSSITWNNIMTYMQLYDAPFEDYQFLVDRYALHLVNVLNGDKNVLESVQIILKEKPKHESRTTGENF